MSDLDMILGLDVPRMGEELEAMMFDPRYAAQEKAESVFWNLQFLGMRVGEA